MYVHVYIKKKDFNSDFYIHIWKYYYVMHDDYKTMIH